MIKSVVITSLAGAAAIGNLYVLAKWRRPRARGSRNLAVTSLACLAIAVLLAFDLFTQIWVARPNSISKPMFLGFGFASIVLSAAAVVTFVARWRKHRHAAA
ncbi:hypothetical protein [Pseudoxanthomonas sp. PXM02]|uniref:hypothetical protein n=1 Tax=Pseudoxanthomonas sp. PXM02 TaxID=2769294 RepID=UPI00177BCF73|nr:hypothetical protein [Pseudoxanthomonas sp. PXM02]MBD9478384.1 hypothetical protein [Pseudoxanthomonas sp. PXM02]